MLLRLLVFGLGCLALASASDAVADPITFDFVRVSNNSSFDVADQLSVSLQLTTGGDVLFIFSNVGALDSTIQTVYWDDDGNVLFKTEAYNTPDFVAASSSSGVDFHDTRDVTGGSKPGGMDWTAEFAICAVSPGANYGVDPGEYAGFVLRLQDGKGLADVSAALLDRSFLMGVHLISLPDGESDWYEAPPIPEPASLLLTGLGLALAAGFHQRRRRSPGI